jgi:hypothetical protein
MFGDMFSGSGSNMDVLYQNHDVKQYLRGSEEADKKFLDATENSGIIPLPHVIIVIINKSCISIARAISSYKQVLDMQDKDVDVNTFVDYLLKSIREKIYENLKK